MEEKKKSRRPSRASLRLGAAGNRTFWLAPGAKRTCSADKLGISVSPAVQAAWHASSPVEMFMVPKIERMHATTA